jgi:hypothetical protein
MQTLSDSFNKLPSEEFLLPVMKFNDAVGPLFSEFRDRFPLNEGIFLAHCFITATDAMMKLRPTPLSKEEWMVAPPELKQEHLQWQRNLAYLRKRNFDFMVKLGYRAKPEDDDSF